MLNKQGFNQWAQSYDQAVSESDRNHRYPFAGYEEIMQAIEKQVSSKKAPQVLDMGFGTGKLTQRLAQLGAEIVGVDFSEKMIEIAKEKIPQGLFICHDFSGGVPEQVKKMSFDFIISTYAIHHLTAIQKQKLLTQLVKLLKEGGEIILGDVLFESRTSMEECRQHFLQDWDEDEIYLVQEEMTDWLQDFQQTWYYASNCSGLVILKKK